MQIDRHIDIRRALTIKCLSNLHMMKVLCAFENTHPFGVQNIKDPYSGEGGKRQAHYDKNRQKR